MCIGKSLEVNCLLTQEVTNQTGGKHLSMAGSHIYI